MSSSVTDEAGSPGNGGALFRSQDGPGHVALCHGSLIKGEASLYLGS